MKKAGEKKNFHLGSFAVKKVKKQTFLRKRLRRRTARMGMRKFRKLRNLAKELIADAVA